MNAFDLGVQLGRYGSNPCTIRPAVPAGADVELLQALYRVDVLLRQSREILAAGRVDGQAGHVAMDPDVEDYRDED